jgi:hypothetical protein
MRIDLKAEYGKQTISRDDGKIVANRLVDAMGKEEEIVIDFSNILIASVSFFDEAFGKLAFKYSKEILAKKLTFKNIEDFDKALLNDILISRYHQKELETKQKAKKKS